MLRLKWILGFWGAVSLFFFFTFLITVKSAGGMVDQPTRVILAFLAISLGAWPAARATTFGARRSPLSRSEVGGLIMVYLGTLVLLAGVYLAAMLPRGIVSLLSLTSLEGIVMLAGVALILTGFRVAVSRESA